VKADAVRRAAAKLLAGRFPTMADVTDQRAALVTAYRNGAPHAETAVGFGRELLAMFPDIPRTQLGAVVLAVGMVLDRTWQEFEKAGVACGPDDLAFLTDTIGEWLYIGGPG
jgi:hypothetical protein